MESLEPEPWTVAVIVNWDGAELLRRHLPTWQRQSMPFARILVVDNGSRDGSLELLGSRPEVTTLALGRNRGFAAAANRGLREALEDPRTDSVALINNDVALEPAWHRQTWAVLATDPGLGAVAGCLLDGADPSRVQSAGIVWDADGWARDHLSGEPSPPPDAPVSPVPGVSAAAALFRRRLFDEVGLFDDAFFAYQEDVDLALRARARGWRFAMTPAARGLHLGRASDRPYPLGGTWADFYNARNRIAVIARSLPAAGFGRSAVRLGRELAGAWSESRAGAVWLGVAQGLLRLPRALWWRRRQSRMSASRRQLPRAT